MARIGEDMRAHDLARILLEGPDLPVATHANNHTSDSEYTRVCIMKMFGGEHHVCIGNISRKHINYPNEYVIAEIDGGDELPENWL